MLQQNREAHSCCFRFLDGGATANCSIYISHIFQRVRNFSNTCRVDNNEVTRIVFVLLRLFFESDSSWWFASDGCHFQNSHHVFIQRDNLLGSTFVGIQPFKNNICTEVKTIYSPVYNHALEITTWEEMFVLLLGEVHSCYGANPSVVFRLGNIKRSCTLS